MKLDKLLLFSSAFLALAIACHALQDVSKATAEAHIAAAKKYSDDENWPMAVERYTLAAETCAREATFLQENDVVKAIEAYRNAALIYYKIAVTALKANLLTQAIEAYKREAQLYTQAAQLCKEADNIETSTFFYTCAAVAYARVTEISGKLAEKCKRENDPIGEASAWFVAADARIESANSFRSAGNVNSENDMYRLAAGVFAISAYIYKAEKSFDHEANAWMRVAETYALSAWIYRQIDDALDGAHMYSLAASNNMNAAEAYKNAVDTEGAIEAYQQAVTWGTIAAQIYHDTWAHNREAIEYLKIARHYLTLNEHALAGGAFELAAQARQHAQDYPAAVGMFQEAEKAYTVAEDPTAVQRVKSTIVACDLTARKLYHEATVRLDLKRVKLISQTELYIRRSHLLLDSYNAVMALKSIKAQTTGYEIVFLEEEGNDRGGLSREWFSLLAHEMACPNNAFFISRNPGDQTYQPNPDKNNLEVLSYYHFFGRVLAMAINSGNLVPFRLTDTLLKHMLKQPVVFEDLSSFDPTLYQSYVALKRMPDPSDMELFFAVHIDDKTVDLCPNGNNVPLTLDNRDEYMGLVTNYYLIVQIQAQLKAFLSGFHLFVHQDCIASLNTRALAWLINGESTLSVDDWEHNTLYEGCSATSMPVIWFWNTVRSFSPEQHAKLLHFATGWSRVPLGGFSKLDPKFAIARIEQGDDHVPSAATCSRRLNLPTYSSEANLRDKLLYAIEEGRVSFGFV